MSSAEKKQQLEIEVKFYITDRSPISENIQQIGGISSGRALEVNTRFDDSQQSLYKKGELLRLRKTAGDNILTYKSLPEKTDRRFKVYNESEMSVSDSEIAIQILNHLGFHAQQVYEKWRESFKLGATHLCLDEMPYGNFLEIEGEPEEIQSVAAGLGLDWEQRILMNYLEIFSRLKKILDLPFSDVTFENFESHHVDASMLATELENLFSAADVGMP